MWLSKKQETQDRAITLSFNVIISINQYFNKISRQIISSLAFKIPEMCNEQMSIHCDFLSLCYFNTTENWLRNMIVFLLDFYSFHWDICSQICYSFLRFFFLWVFFYLCLNFDIFYLGILFSSLSFTTKLEDIFNVLNYDFQKI